MQYQERIWLLSADISKMPTWELEIMLCEPKNIRTNEYKMTASTLKLHTNKILIYHETWSPSAALVSSRTYLVNAWWHSTKDYTTVASEVLGFGDWVFIQVFISCCAWFKWQGFGNSGVAAGPSAWAGGYFLKEVSACGETKLEVQIMRRTCTGAQKKCNEEGARKGNFTDWLQPLIPLLPVLLAMKDEVLSKPASCLYVHPSAFPSQFSLILLKRYC